MRRAGGEIVSILGYNPAHAVTEPDATWDSTLTLLTRARAGDAQALDDLFARYLPGLRKWASGRLPRWARDLIDTPDLVQDVLRSGPVTLAISPTLLIPVGYQPAGWVPRVVTVPRVKMKCSKPDGPLRTPATWPESRRLVDSRRQAGRSVEACTRGCVVPN